MNTKYLRSVLLYAFITGFVFAQNLVISEPVFAKGEWEEIRNEQGVRVYQKEVPGRDLPVFKGVGIIKENIFDVLAVLYDVPRRTEWVHKCIDSKILKEFGELERMVYNRTDAPWPINDRDVIVRTYVKIDRPNMRLKVDFKSTNSKDMPKVDGVVRMNRLTGFYEIQAINEKKTRVTYLVDADPGGWLPNWVIKIASKDIPMKTVANLRKQVAKTKARGMYKTFLDRWSKDPADNNEEAQAGTPKTGAPENPQL